MDLYSCVKDAESMTVVMYVDYSELMLYSRTYVQSDWICMSKPAAAAVTHATLPSVKIELSHKFDNFCDAETNHASKDYANYAMHDRQARAMMCISGPHKGNMGQTIIEVLHPK